MNLLSKDKSEDWRYSEQRERSIRRRKAMKRIFILFGGPALIVVCLMAMTYLVFLHDWALWLFPIGVFTAIGCFWGCNVDDHKINDEVFKAISGVLTAAYVLGAIIYGGIKGDLDLTDQYHDTVLACGLDSERDDDGNVNWILRTPEGSYNVEAGTYYLLKNGKQHRHFAATAEEAAKLFNTGSAYKLTVDPLKGASYDGVVTAKQVPNTLGSCSDD